jgi:ABC-type hemin transport system substrate-binding protein
LRLEEFNTWLGVTNHSVAITKYKALSEEGTLVMSCSIIIISNNAYFKIAESGF